MEKIKEKIENIKILEKQISINLEFAKSEKIKLMFQAFLIANPLNEDGFVQSVTYSDRKYKNFRMTEGCDIVCDLYMNGEKRRINWFVSYDHDTFKLKE